MSADGLPPLREVVQTHGLMPKRSLGQNFLFDLNLTRRIARAAGPLASHTILEVGPGPGGLTRALLAEGAECVIAIERDPRCLPALAEIAAHYPGRLEIVEADAMDCDPAALLAGRPSRIVANLPYNIGTALLTKWIATESWPPLWSSATLMFQREVADRIVSDERRPDDYGRLGVLCGWRTRAQILFEIPPQAFVPPPKVTSAVVLIEPRPEPAPCQVRALEAVTRAAFGQRRKMLRQSLKALVPDPAPLFEETGIAPTVRAEEVPVAGFVALANAYSRTRG
jgi:16S rRNA (adenine1518-N6/adenine1519-N6)-dimethyltransferase